MTNPNRSPDGLRIGVFLLLIGAASIAGYLVTQCGREHEVLRASTVDTRAFDGHYRLVPEASFVDAQEEIRAVERELSRRQALGEPASDELGSRMALLRANLDRRIARWSDLVIERGVLRAGRGPVQEFSLVRAAIAEGRLNGTALWHEDVQDPGDCADVPLRLELRGARLSFALGDERSGFESAAEYERATASP